MKTLDEAMRRAAESASRLLSYPEADDPKKEEGDAARYIIKHALASLAADGYALVPRIATEDMLATGKIAAVTTHRVDQVYESMVAAAPKFGGGA